MLNLFDNPCYEMLSLFDENRPVIPFKGTDEWMAHLSKGRKTIFFN
jgi:hypothetical protein